MQGKIAKFLQAPMAVACALAAAPIASAAIPVLNGTCPGGIEVHADQGGPVYVNGRETSLKRFNDNYYEARDGRSGVTLSLSVAADGSPQLSYTGSNGSNGICQIGAPAPGDGPAAHAQHGGHHHHDDEDDGGGNLPAQVTCESEGKQQTSCEMNTRGAVVVDRQLSRSRCVEGQTWGLSPHAVWVSDGCRATFRNTSVRAPAPVRGGNGGGGPALAACDDRKGERGTLVTQLPVGDSYTEVIVDYADGRHLCMVTRDGAVSSLTPMRRR